MKKKKRAGINCLVPFLFAVYMVLLVWIILFKLQLSIHDLDTVRNINLIPFHYENEIGMNFLSWRFSNIFLQLAGQT